MPAVPCASVPSQPVPTPGPVVYGLGGVQVTLSDANAILGRLDAEHFLGGSMALDLAAGERALAALAQQIGFSLTDTAKGVIDIANVNIDRAIRRVSIARGYDPRDFALVAFGGAGPLHACEAAARLDIPRVLVPPAPGVLCALGLLIADVAVDYSQSVMDIATAQRIAALAKDERDLRALAVRELEQENITGDQMRFAASLDMRYEGQAYELNIPFSDAAIADFHTTHEETYGHAMRWRRTEIVNLRLKGSGIIDKPQFEATVETPHEAVPFSEKVSPLGGTIKLYERAALAAGAEFTGEALVFQMDSTTYLPSGWRAHVDGYLNLLLEPV